jgi:hypothetical protein
MKMIRPGPVVLSNVLIFSLACPSAFAGFGDMLEKEGQSVGEQEGKKMLSTEETKLKNAYANRKAAKQPATEKTTASTIDKEKAGNGTSAVNKQVAEKQALNKPAKKESEGRSLFRKAEQSLENNAAQDASGLATRHMP